MRLSAKYTAAKGRANGNRTGELRSRAITQTRSFRHELIQSRIDIIGKLDLRHWPHAISSHADGNPDDTTFADRSVETARFTMLFLKISSRTEYTAEITHIFPQNDDIVIPGHHNIEATVNGFYHIHDGHLISRSLFA